jgi:hypothetical protein
MPRAPPAIAEEPAFGAAAAAEGGEFPPGILGDHAARSDTAAGAAAREGQHDPVDLPLRAAR